MRKGQERQTEGEVVELANRVYMYLSEIKDRL